MRKALQILILLAVTLFPASASGDGFDNPLGATHTEGLRTVSGALTVEKGDYRYFSLTPQTRPRLTVIGQISKADATLERWWYLHGNYWIPAVASDGSPGGISADGDTLVLMTPPQVSPTQAYPPKQSTFAVIDTRSSRQAITHLTLPGPFSFHAISPDGSRIYLLHYFYAGEQASHYEVRAVDTATGRLLPGRIVDPSAPEERMDRVPLTRLQSPDGRWAYTLYGAKTPFLQVLDTVHGRFHNVDLPQLTGGRASFWLQMRFIDGGDRIEVYPSGQKGASRTERSVAIDTETYDVSRPAPGSTATASGIGTDDVPWLVLAAAAAALAVAIVWRRRAAR